jgi:hypothetical protein
MDCAAPNGTRRRGIALHGEPAHEAGQPQRRMRLPGTAAKSTGPQAPELLAWR